MPRVSFRPAVQTLEDRLVPTTTDYVNALYNNLLHRTPVGTEAAVWIRAIDTGAPPVSVSSAIVGSAEYQRNFIRSSYQLYFDRVPSNAEVDHWFAQTQQGLRLETLQAVFLASNEFYVRSGNNNLDWLRNVYERGLGRSRATITDVELIPWFSQLGSGLSRGEVVERILDSPEAHEHTVRGVFNLLLARDPDTNGLVFWRRALEQGLPTEDMLALVAASGEYTRAYQPRGAGTPPGLAGSPGFGTSLFPTIQTVGPGFSGPLGPLTPVGGAIFLPTSIIGGQTFLALDMDLVNPFLLDPTAF